MLPVYWVVGTCVFLVCFMFLYVLVWYVRIGKCAFFFIFVLARVVYGMRVLDENECGVRG